MKHLLRAALLALALAAGMHTPAAGQSDILLRLRSGIPAGDRFRVDSAGGLVAMGSLGIGIIPASGEGWRMMWHPYKAAFRAGGADAGGQFNESNIGFYSWGGGNLSIAAGIYSFAMGNLNTVEGGAPGGVAMGAGNKITSISPATTDYAVAIGLNNDVKDDYGMAVGFDNTADGIAAVALGYRTTADADYSMAFGYRASTNGYTGAKVFGDASTTDSIEAIANNEFAVRAAGGFRFRTNATLSNGCSIGAGGTSWVCSSSRTLKDNFAEVDGEDVLRRIRSIPLNSWNLTDEPSRARHMGPFAEDFHAAFGLGDDPRAIGHQDIDGVNFAGVQALDARTLQMQARIDAQAEQIEQLRADKAALEARLQRLEALAAAPPAP